ncbi:MAG: FAD-dependent oxidoreductase [Pseudomonadota bacterium]
MADVRLLSIEGVAFPVSVGVLIIGAGAAGITAALAAHDRGADVLVLERDPVPLGSTSMSSGFVPAAGTRAQTHQGIEDDATRFAEDIGKKAGGRAVPSLVALATREIAPAVDWLEQAHGLEWEVLDGFLYPGHSRHRMHAVPERTGAALLERLLSAAAAAGIPIATGARVTALYAGPDGQVRGAETTRTDGATELIGCDALILACCGYGANREVVARHIPLMADAPYWGHPGNTGDALVWGQGLGAAAACLSGAQGHGSLAHPHGALITWALMMEGGIQVNADGRRFSNEHRGYSEQAVDVLSQPGAVAWCIFDARLREMADGFPDFREAAAAGAVLQGDAAALARATGLPADALAQTLQDTQAFADGRDQDPHGRDFTTNPPLGIDLFAVRVTGALFHTQGGLMIGDDARVLHQNGQALPNLFAAGGAACGVSGDRLDGYLSGNGLLSAIAFGRVAGREAGRVAGVQISPNLPHISN